MTAVYHAIEGLQIAIDGPSGSGKGTVAKALGAAIGLPVLDTGLLYRLLGFLSEKHGVSAKDASKILALLQQSEIVWNAEGLFLNGESCTELLRSEAIGRLASTLAGLPEVRAALLDWQRKVATKGCVMDGRDIGTVVLPDAQAKFFLTASKRTRARRRWLQLQEMGREDSLDDVLHDMQDRDQQDCAREHAPLQCGADAISIDTTILSIEDVLERMQTVLLRRGLLNVR